VRYTDAPIIEQLPDRHRLWHHAGAELPSQFYIIDDSGEHPSETDDVPLHLDFGRSLLMETDCVAIR
jgi:hypothetical protein